MSAMKAKIISVAVCLVAVCASAQGLSAQGLLSRQSRISRPKPQPLEPLLPFAEAVEKAKKGEAQGCYALAIHYAKGDEIDRDAEKARFFLKKAAAADYGNAVLVDTICLEQSSVGEREVGCGLWPSVTDYVGTGFFYPFGRYEERSLTNSADVASIRAGYERAFRLGVTVATNELARFEQRLEAANAEAKRRSDEARQKIDNAALAKSALNIPTENMEQHREREEQRTQLLTIKEELRKAREAREAHTRLSSELAQSTFSAERPSASTNQDLPTTTLWEAGGTNGLSFVVVPIYGARASTNDAPYAGRARITIDSDGRIVKVEGLPTRTDGAE